MVYVLLEHVMQDRINLATHVQYVGTTNTVMMEQQVVHHVIQPTDMPTVERIVRLMREYLAVKLHVLQGHTYRVAATMVVRAQT